MRVLVILLILISSVAQADPGKRRTKEERQKARIEREHARNSARFDERSPDQKLKDRKILVLMAFASVAVVKGLVMGE